MLMLLREATITVAVAVQHTFGGLGTALPSYSSAGVAIAIPFARSVASAISITAVLHQIRELSQVLRPYTYKGQAGLNFKLP